MPHSDSSSSKAWAGVVWTVVACIVAAPICLFAAFFAVLIFLYGVDMLWEGIPESMERGPGDGFFIFMVPPVALVFWLVSVVLIRTFASRLRARSAKSAQFHL